MSWVLVQQTLGSGATQISTANTFCRQIIIQNNAAHSMRVGDSTVTASKGIYLAAGPGGGSINSGPASPVYNSYISDFWVFGTSGDVVDVLVNE